jgi:predicted nucleotide-binding protein (sugar kinase/HSP70/actin superfamily)
VLPESPWFEALGSALLTRDEPLYKMPQIAKQAAMSRLAPLQACSERVQIIAAPLPQDPPDGPMILGLDAGSTTTSNAGFCFPAQIAHGAVLNLVKGDVNLIFLPHVSHLPSPNPCQSCLLCPITQASPNFVAKAFPGVRLLSPVLDFAKGYAASPALVEMAVNNLAKPRNLAEQAWTAAVRAQIEFERALGVRGCNALAQAVASGKPAVLLAGHPYSALTPEASQSVGKKLSSMGIAVIPTDCLAPVDEGPMAWHFANQILHAVATAKQHRNLFLLCISNFSCTIDAFTQSLLASEMGTKPYLILEIDAHTADAGVQTRLEAYLLAAGRFDSY